MLGIDALLSIGSTLIDRLIPDKEAQEKAKLELLEMQQKGELAQLDAALKSDTAQLDVNKVEAASQSVFVAGWRPFVGWICGVGFGLNMVLIPIANYALVASGRPEVNLSLDTASLMTLLFGMLGMGGMRSWEKAKRVAR